MILDNKNTNLKVHEWIAKYTKEGKFSLVTGYFTVGALAYISAKINEKIKEFNFVLGDIVHTENVKVRTIDLLNENIAQGAFEMNDLVSETKDETHPKPFVEGKHLDRWLPATNKWLEWGTERAPSMFRRPTFPQIYEVDDKILVQRSPGPDPKACYDNQRLHFTESSVGFIPWHSLSGVRNRSLNKSARYHNEKPPRPDLPNREELEKTSRRFAVKFLLAVMNSSAAHNFLRANRRSNIHLYPNDWKQLPIPDISFKQQSPVVKLVNDILTSMRADRTASVVTLEAEIDARVSHLYKLTEEEYALVLKETNCPDPFRVAALNVYRDIAREKLK